MKGIVLAWWVRHSVVSDYEGGVEADAPSV